jgi:hypothetical protein
MLTDLRRAGLPGKAEALVISISEAWFLLSGAFLGAAANFVTEAVGSVKESLALQSRPLSASSRTFLTGMCDTHPPSVRLRRC